MPFTVDNLIDALMLLLHSTRDDTKALINEMVEIYDRERKDSVDLADNIYAMYIDLLRGMNTQDLRIADRQAIDVFLLKLKSHPEVIKDPDIYTNLQRVLHDTTAMSDDQQRSLSRKVGNVILVYKNTKLLRKMTNKMSRARSSNLSADFQDAIMAEVTTLCTDIIQNNQDTLASFVDNSDTTKVPKVDFSDKDNIKRALTAQQEISVKGLIKTGWQGLNRALAGGIPRGSSIVFNALAGTGKTLMLLKMLRWQVTLNDPPVDVRNPTCILYSLENETPHNLKLLYNELYVNKYREVPPSTWSVDQMADFCFDEFAAHGWRLVIDRRLPTDFGYSEFVSDFNSYVKEGFTPLMVVIDYMNMMRKGSGSRESRNDLQIRELYLSVRNFTNANGCTLVSAHQLNRTAAEVARINPTNAVKRFGIDMLSDATDPQREVDITIYQHKERDMAGNWWLTFKLDKDRYRHNTPDNDKYFAYRFDPQLGILDDIHGEDMSSNNINRDAMTDGTEETMATITGDVLNQ